MFRISLVHLKHFYLGLTIKEAPASSSVHDKTDVYNQVFYHQKIKGAVNHNKVTL